MKKLIFLLICLMLVSVNVFAEEAVLEMPDIKIIMDGEQKIFTDIPIVVNDRTLLPLRQILVYLGVPNDDQHIIWDQPTQSVTVRNNGTEIYLKLYDNKAKVNGTEIVLDVASTAHKERTYIPARFVSEVLKKKVYWDGDYKAVYIMGEEAYNETQAILDKVQSVNSNVKDLSANVTYDIKLTENSTSKTTTFKNDINLQFDFVNFIAHLTSKTNIFEEAYFTDEEAYLKIKGKPWMMDDIKKFKNIGILDISNAALTQSAYTGLKVDKSASNGSEIVLKGDVLLKDVFNLIIFSGQADTGQMDEQTPYHIAKSFNVTLTIDRATNQRKKLEVNAVINTPAISNQTVNANMVYQFYDYNKGLVIKVPYTVEVEAQPFGLFH